MEKDKKLSKGKPVSDHVVPPTISQMLETVSDEENSGHQGKRGPRKSGLVSYLFRCFLWLFLAVFVFFCGCSIYLYVNRDEIKSMFVQEINHHLLSPVSVQDIQLGMLRDFPKVSVTFLGTSCYSPTENEPEILFTAENITLSFNIKDIIRKRYIVREVLVRGGEFNLKHYGGGRYNYVIWKQQEKDSARAVSFHLQRAVLRNTLIRFRDLPAQHDFQIRAVQLQARGDLYDNGQEFRLRGQVDVHQMTASDFTFLSRKKARLNLHFVNNQSERRFTVKQGEVEVANLQFDAKGFVRYQKTDPYIDFRFVGQKMRLESLILLLPEEEQAIFKNYSFTGNLGFAMDIRGDYTHAPLQVLADFELSQARVRHKPSKIEARDIRFQGQFANGKQQKRETCRLKVDKLFAQLPSGTVEGAFSLSNFVRPEVKYRGELRADLSELQKFLGFLPDVELMGKAQADVSFHNVFPSMQPKDWKTSDLNKSFVDGQLWVKGLVIRQKDLPDIVSDSLVIDFSPRVFKTNVFRVECEQNRLQARLFLENVLPYLLHSHQKLYVTADMDASYVDVDRIMALLSTRNNHSRSSRKLIDTVDRKPREWFSTLYADVDFTASTVVVGETKVEHLKGLLHYSPGDIVLENLSLNAFQGYMEGYLAMNQTPRQWLLAGKGNIGNMDIGACFKAFHNFGQESLTYKNISGRLSSRFEFTIPYLTDTHKWDVSQLALYTEAEVGNGVLQDMESLRTISRFTGENDLQLIRFADLETQVSIQDRTIEFSRTKINSDAANLIFQGTHSFDNHVNYMVNIELSDLLSKRRRNRVNKDEEFGVVMETEGSRIMLPLSIVGTWPDVQVKYAMKEARKGASERLRENRLELKQSLQDEFSSLRKKRQEKKDERKKEKIQENGQFLFDVEDVGLKDATKQPEKKKPADTLPRKKYDTEDDFRIEFDDN